MKKKIYLAIITIALMTPTLLSGCTGNDTDVVNEPVATVVEIPIETMEAISEEAVTETAVETESMESTTEVATEVTTIKSITISILNLSDINIGMFSAIDPTTKEQMNLNRLDSGTSLSFECNWPSDTAEFQWALYNESGELCLEASTDISTATKSATLILKGEGTIDDVDVTIE